MNKQDVISSEDLELYYNKCRKVKLIHNDSLPIQTILDEVITQKHPTYFKTGTKQCGVGHYRSLDDVLKVCKYYYPEMSLSNIMKEIVIYANKFSDIKINDRDRLFLQFCYCPNIRKDNFRGLTRYSWGDDFEKLLHKSSMYSQGFRNCNITLQEIIDN